MPDPSPRVHAQTGTTAALRLPGGQLTVHVPEGMGPDERVVLRSTDEAATYRRALAPNEARPVEGDEGFVALVFDGLSPELSYTLVLDHDGREDDEAGDEVVFDGVPFAELKRLERGEDVGGEWLSDEAEHSQADPESLARAGVGDETFGDEQWDALLEEEGLAGTDR